MQLFVIGFVGDLEERGVVFFFLMNGELQQHYSNCGVYCSINLGTSIFLPQADRLVEFSGKGLKNDGQTAPGREEEHQIWR
jgi:hypothetical protein